MFQRRVKLDAQNQRTDKPFTKEVSCPGRDCPPRPAPLGHPARSPSTAPLFYPRAPRLTSNGVRAPLGHSQDQERSSPGHRQAASTCASTAPRLRPRSGGRGAPPSSFRALPRCRVLRCSHPEQMSLTTKRGSTVRTRGQGPQAGPSRAPRRLAGQDASDDLASGCASPALLSGSASVQLITPRRTGHDLIPRVSKRTRNTAQENASKKVYVMA